MRAAFSLFLIIMVGAVGAQPVSLVVPSGHAKSIERITASPDGKYVASISYKTALVWDVASNKKIHEVNLDISLFASETNSLSITDKLDKVLACTNSGLFCYNIQSGQKIFSDGGITSGAAFGQNGTIVYAVDNGSFNVLDANSGKKILAVYKAVNSSANKCRFYELGNNRLLVLYYFGWSIINTVTGEIVLKKEFKDIYSLKMEAYDYNPGNNTVIGLRNDSLIAYDVNTANVEKTKKPLYNPRGFCISSADQLVLFSADYKRQDYKIEVMRLPAFDVIKTATLSAAEVPGAIYYGDRAAAVAGKVFFNNDRTVFFFNPATATYERKFNNRIADFQPFFVYGNLSQRLMADRELRFATNDNGIRQFNAENYKPESYVQGTDRVTNRVVLSGDGKLAVTVDKKAVLLNAVTGKAIRTITLPATIDPERCFFFFNYNNTKLVCCEGLKGSLTAIDIATGAAAKLAALGELIMEASASVDGKYFAGITSKSNMHYLTIYDLEKRATVMNKRLCDPSKDAGCPTSIHFLNDSYYIIITSQQQNVNIYKADDAAYISSFQLPHYNPFLILGGDLKSDMIAIGEVGQFQVGAHNLKLVTRDGKLLKEFKSVDNSYFLKATFSADAKVMFTPTTQKGVQVWDVRTGKLLGTYYLVEKSGEYVFVSPEGLFDGSVEGMKELYFVKNNKPIPLEKLYERYFTPDLLRRKINGEQFSPPDVAGLLDAPTVSIAYAAVQRNLEVADDRSVFQNTTGAAEITVTARAAESTIDEIRLFHNGKIVTLVTRNLIVADDQSGTAVKKYTLPLLPGSNTIRAVALNAQRTESDPDEITVLYQSGANNSNEPKPVNKRNAAVAMIDKNATMYLVVVGINAYKNTGMSLNYALADATAFKEEVERDAKTVISNIKTYFITDHAADKAGITNAINEVQQKAKPQDVFMFYYAGHGVIANGNKEFYLVPNDVADLKNVDEVLKTNGIAAKELQKFAIDIQAQKQLFILDACQSAGAFAEMLSADGNQQKNIALVARSTGTHWMAASGAQQFANEFSTLGHGAFTYVLLQALKGAAANDKMITVDGLKDYMQTGVPELMKKYNGSQQTPASYGFGNDFPVELLK